MVCVILQLEVFIIVQYSIRYTHTKVTKGNDNYKSIHCYKGTLSEAPYDPPISESGTVKAQKSGVDYFNLSLRNKKDCDKVILLDPY